MNSVHDLGGMDGFGRVDPETDEPIFHAEWEKRVFGMFPATLFLRYFNLDEMRHAIERMGSTNYLTTTYYEHWLHAFEMLLVEKGVLTEAELESGHAASSTDPDRDILTPESAHALAVGGGSTRIDAEVAPKFRVGDRIRAKNIHPMGHTRLPRYTRGKVGEIIEDHGVFIFADAHARGEGASPQHVYSVRFSARELFGADAPSKDSVVADLWDDHLDPA